MEQAGGETASALFAEAVRLHGRGALEQAARRCLDILRSHPRHFEARHLLGVIRAQQGRLGEACDHLRRAVAERPDAAEANNNLGLALSQAGRHEEALAPLQKATAVNPRHALAHNNLGNAHRSLGDHRLALTCYRQALAIKPDYVEALSNLGAALHGLDRDEEALAPLRRAVRLAPGFAEACLNLGICLQALERREEAGECFEAAIAANPACALAVRNLGVLHMEMGRLDEAHDCFRKAVAMEPHTSAYYLDVVQPKKVADGDPHLAAMEAMLAKGPSLPDFDRARLHFGLGKAYADIGRQEHSFRHYLDGNALVRKKTSYDEEATLRLFDRIRSVFTAALMREKSGLGDPSPAPVFILGMLRSGSTLVEQMLASHPRVRAAGERPDFGLAVSALRLADGTPAEYPQAVPQLPGTQLRRLAADYLARLGAAQLDGTIERVTDKMPANFRYAGLIHLALANARIIHTRRDPVDTCLSCFSKLFVADQPFTYDLAELGRYYRAYADLMEHWRTVLPQGVMLEVRYERLVDDLAGEARRIIAHCGLEWDDACLSFHRTVRPVKTASVVQVRQPLFRSSIGRWRPEHDVLKPLLDGLGPRAS